MTNCHVLDRWWRSKHSRCTLWFSVWLLPLLDFESLMVMLIIPSFSCFFRSPSRGGLNLDIVHTYQQPQLLLWNSSTGKEINHFTEPMTCITGRVTRVFMQHTDCTFKKVEINIAEIAGTGHVFIHKEHHSTALLWEWVSALKILLHYYRHCPAQVRVLGISQKKKKTWTKLNWPNVTIKTAKTHKATSCFFDTFSVFDLKNNNFSACQSSVAICFVICCQCFHNWQAFVPVFVQAFDLDMTSLVPLLSMHYHMYVYIIKWIVNLFSSKKLLYFGNASFAHK